MSTVNTGNKFFSIYGDFGDLSENHFGHVRELTVVRVQEFAFCSAFSAFSYLSPSSSTNFGLGG